MVGDTELERLVVRLMGDSTHYQKTMKDAEGVLGGMVKSIDKASMSLGGFNFGMRRYASEVMGALGPIGVAMGGIGLALQSISMAATAEKMRIDLGVMLQSADAGKEMVKDLTKFAAQTPLELPQLIQASKTLLQFGLTSEEIIPSLRMLGDAVMGDAQKFSHIALVFGQVKSAGKLMGNDMFQFINAGFNPLSEMARTSGKSMAYLKDEMSKGRITFDMVREAMRTATSQGGRFFKGMEEGSKGLTGLFSTMKDDIGAALTTLGEDLIESLRLKDVVKSVSATAQAITEGFKGLPPEIRTLISALSALTGTVLAGNVAWLLLGPAIVGTAQAIVAGVMAIVKVVALLQVAALAAAAPNMFLVAALGSGLVIFAAAAVAIGALGYGIYRLSDAILNNTDEWDRYNAAIAESRSLSSRFVQAFEYQTQKILEAAELTPEPLRKSFLEEQLEAAEKDLQGHKSAAEEAKRQVEEYDSLLNRVGGSRMLETTQADLTAVNAVLEGSRDRVKQLKSALHKLDPKEVEAALTKSFNKLKEKYDMAGRTMHLTGVEADIVRQKLEKATPAQLAEIRALAERNEVALKDLKNKKELKEETDKLTKSLWEEMEALGRTSNQAKLHKLEMMGLSDAARTQLHWTMMLAKGVDKYGELMKAGKELTKEVRTPTEVYRDRTKELQNMLRAGAITQGVFNKAAKEAKKTLREAAAAAANARGELERLDAVLVGSSEDMALLMGYRERMFGGVPADTTTGPSGGTAPWMGPVGQPTPLSPEKQAEAQQQSVALLKAAIDHLATIAEAPLVKMVTAGLK